MIIDSHAYIGSDYHTYYHQIGHYDLKAYKGMMNGSSISKAVLIPGGLGKEVVYHYDQICQTVRKEKEHFMGFVRLNPRYPDVLITLEKALKTKGISGVFLHPHWDTYPAESPLVHPIFDFLRSKDVPVMIYSGDAPYALPGQIANMASRYPDVPVIMGHMGKTEVYQGSINAALRSDNIYLETSGCNIREIIEDAVRKIGAERILFGTGWPGMSPYAEIVKIKSLRIHEKDKQKILYDNAYKLFFNNKGETTDPC